jgi:hypothetical protein
MYRLQENVVSRAITRAHMRASKSLGRNVICITAQLGRRCESVCTAGKTSETLFADQD